jgi:hypothetical protein
MEKHKPERVNFLSKIWKACSTDKLRPAMQCVYIKDGHFYATNGYILAAHHCMAHDLTEEQVKPADGKLIHRTVMADIFKYNRIEFSEEGITAFINQNGTGSYILYPYYNADVKFPDVQKILVLPKRDVDTPSLDEFGINLYRLQELIETFVPNNSANFRFRVVSTMKAYFVQPEGLSYQLGIIMPTHLNDESISENNVVKHHLSAAFKAISENLTKENESSNQ